MRGNNKLTGGTKLAPLAASKQRSVAYGNKVMDTRLPQPAGCGDKYDVSGLGCRRMLSAICKFFKYPSPEAYALPSPSRGEGSGLLRSARNDVNIAGRSMIEMLGVLAIIGVLSVGGIAGYSKAMEKWKLNKAIGNYSMMIQGILEHREDFLRQSHEIETFSLTVTDTLQALNLVPANWQRVGNRYLVDSMGNQIDVLIAPALYDMPDRIYINILLGGIHTNEENYFTEGFSAKLCTTLYTDLIIPLQNSIWKTVVYRKNSGNPPAWAGSAYCTKDEKCLSNMTLKDIHELCSSCNGKNEVCGVDFNII